MQHVCIERDKTVGKALPNIAASIWKLPIVPRDIQACMAYKTRWRPGFGVTIETSNNQMDVWAIID